MQDKIFCTPDLCYERSDDWYLSLPYKETAFANFDTFNCSLYPLDLTIEGIVIDSFKG